MHRTTFLNSVLGVGSASQRFPEWLFLKQLSWRLKRFPAWFFLKQDVMYVYRTTFVRIDGFNIWLPYIGRGGPALVAVIVFSECFFLHVFLNWGSDGSAESCVLKNKLEQFQR